MASNASYLDVRSMAFSRSIVLYRLSSTNIMLFFVQSCFNLMLIFFCEELVARRQYSASFPSNRSNLLWFALIIRVGVISARLGLANGLDNPVV